MTRHRALVLASLPRFCQVCGGDRQVVMAPVGAPELAARVPCPHCDPDGPRLPLQPTPQEANR